MIKILNIELPIPMIISAIWGLLGVIIGSVLTYRREEKNRRKNIRIEYLVNAYRDIGIFITRQNQECMTTEIYKLFEIAVRNIQIYGSPAEITLLQDYIDYLENPSNNEYSMDPLLNKLRDNLRKELKLKKLQGNTSWVIMKEFAN